MTETARYPKDIIQASLDRHLLDAKADAEAWLAQVIELLRDQVASIPPPVEHMDSIPDYIYPH